MVPKVPIILKTMHTRKDPVKKPAAITFCYDKEISFPASCINKVSMRQNCLRKELCSTVNLTIMLRL